MQSILGVLNPGEMGSAIGAGLVQGGHRVLWAAAGRSDATAHRATQAGLVDVGTVDRLVAQCDVLFSVCPPHAAAEVALAVRGFHGIFVEANAISPRTVRDIAMTVGSAGASVVDGGIIGPPTQASTAERTRLYVAGSQAPSVAQLFDSTPVDVRIVDGDVGAASALKMAYAAWSKGTAALLLAIRALARASAVETDLLREWDESLPDLPGRSLQVPSDGPTKGWRWIGEMGDAGIRRPMLSPRRPASGVGGDLPTGIRASTKTVAAVLEQSSRRFATLAEQTYGPVDHASHDASRCRTERPSPTNCHVRSARQHARDGVAAVGGVYKIPHLYSMSRLGGLRVERRSRCGRAGRGRDLTVCLAGQRPPRRPREPSRGLALCVTAVARDHPRMTEELRRTPSPGAEQPSKTRRRRELVPRSSSTLTGRLPADEVPSRTGRTELAALTRFSRPPCPNTSACRCPPAPGRRVIGIWIDLMRWQQPPLALRHSRRRRGP